jgi:hypothetical protein
MTEKARYAVLFKTHFWDDFCERQLRRLCARVGTGSVFVVVDETRGPVAGIGHPDVVRLTDRTPEEEGYLRHPEGNVFWYNGDYQLYHFLDRFPDYDYVVICEYDCTLDLDLDPIVEAMAARGLGFVGERNKSPPATWRWQVSARPYYAPDLEILGRLVCFAVFSRTFLRQLQEARRDHTRRVRAQQAAGQAPEPLPWPHIEAFIGAEIRRLAVAEAPLSDFGDVQHYDWSPPYLEAELPHLAPGGFIHPVLDGPRFIRSMLNLRRNLEDLFRDGSALATRLEACDPAEVVPLFLEHFMHSRNLAAVAKLRHYAERRAGAACRPLFNVARGKPATQSSTSPWSRSASPSEDAVGAVTGLVTGGFGFHTELEDAPWWCVDLETVYPVRDIVIHNRLGQRARAASLVVMGSTDLIYWRTLYRHAPAPAFGGADGHPLRITLADPVELRFLRLQLTERQVLHLDQVEVYI